MIFFCSSSICSQFWNIVFCGLSFVFCNVYIAQDYLVLLWPTNILPNTKAKIQQFWQDLILEGFSFFGKPLASISDQLNSIVLVLESPKQVLWLKFEKAAFQSKHISFSLVPLPQLLQHWLSYVLWKLSGPVKAKAGLLFKFIKTSCM